MPIWLGIVFVLAVILDLALVRLSHGIWHEDGAAVPVRVGGAYSPVLTWLYSRGSLRPRLRQFSWQQAWALVGPYLEISAIVVFAAWLGRDVINTPDTRWPYGADFGLNVQGYFAWPAVWKCGLCVFWNGTLNGGSPLFAELLAAIAHPLVVLFILTWGVIGGLKATLVAGLAIAGLGQWWLSKSLRLGTVARLWSAAMAMVGGHLAARMENGLVEEVFSIASCGLLIPAALDLVETGSRRATLVFGVLLALSLLAGQGYMQIGMILGIFPAFLILLLGRDLRLRPVWRNFVLAGGLAVLLTAFYWIPFLHFFPNFSKPTDPNFNSAEALAYIPLNLVIRDLGFYSSEVLGKVPWPHLYANYIGWVPVLLALLALRLVPREGQRKLVFFLAAVVLVYLAASALTFRLIQWIPIKAVSDLATLARFPSEIASLAVAPLLALAAWGLDLLLKLKWPRLTVSVPSGAILGLSAAWVLVGVPLVGAVYSAYDFGHQWLTTTEVPADYYRVVPKIKPPQTAWVEPPFDDRGFAVVALSNGYNLTNAYQPTVWRDRNPPPAVLRATRDAVDPATPGYQGKVEYLSLIAQPQNHFASVNTAAGVVPCDATALGGNIDVTCQADQPGQLVVLENYWSGWSVTRDGARVALDPGGYLATAAPAGKHVYRFRYRPWDVALGVLVTLAGIALTIWLWRNPPMYRSDGNQLALPFA